MSVSRCVAQVGSRARLAVAVMALSVLAAHTAQAVVLLDQEHNFVSGVANTTNGNVSEVGQTFTAGLAGTLDHIDVLMFRLGSIFDPTSDPVLKVYNTAGGLPTGAPLVTVSVPEALVPLNVASFVTFDVSGAGIAVNVGDVLAFGISTPLGVGPYFLLVDGDTGQAEDYANGQAVSRILNNPPDPWQAFNPAQDHGFRTFVDAIPEPASVALLGLAGLVLISNRRRD